MQGNNAFDGLGCCRILMQAANPIAVAGARSCACAWSAAEFGQLQQLSSGVGVRQAKILPRNDGASDLRLTLLDERMENEKMQNRKVA